MKKAKESYHTHRIDEGLLDSLLNFVQSAGDQWIKASKVEYDKIKKGMSTGSDAEPGTIDAQVAQVSSTLQIVGYSVEVVVERMPQALDDMSSGVEPGEEGYVEYITESLERINEILGEASGWLIQGSNNEADLAAPVRGIAKTLEAKKSISENAQQLLEAYGKINQLDLAGQANTITTSEQGKQALMGPVKWAQQYIDEGLGLLKGIGDAISLLGEAARAAEQAQELLDEMAKQPDAVDDDSAVSSNVFTSEALRRHIRLLIAEEIRNGS